jgi:hypothetical protein
MPSNKKNKKKDKGTSGNDAGGLVKYCPEGQALWLANMLASCANCGKGGNNLKICGTSGMAKFCSIGCQKANWNVHKLLCKSIKTNPGIRIQRLDSPIRFNVGGKFDWDLSSFSLRVLAVSLTGSFSFVQTGYCVISTPVIGHHGYVEQCRSFMGQATTCMQFCVTVGRSSKLPKTPIITLRGCHLQG